jgi:hypothetical protein
VTKKAAAKKADKAGEAPSDLPVPASETPEGATAEAEAAEGTEKPGS